MADEPTTVLDVTVQAEILELLHRCRTDFGTAVLLITHNMGVGADLADWVAVMSEGEVVEQAPVRELFAAPAIRTPANCSPPCPPSARAAVRRRPRHGTSGRSYGLPGWSWTSRGDWGERASGRSTA
ncbi:hypothetical protein [Streptomyces sp. NPDC091209]|uniref:hypothetical protein n=1 Tax=Streptomyces sp. NPDC091209 TaxID=3365974 RepID=UPI00381F4D5B